MMKDKYCLYAKKGPSHWAVSWIYCSCDNLKILLSKEITH